MNLLLLKQELSQLHHNFAEGELAYLALTSKADIPIRDRLAFQLQKRLSADRQNLLCARDWRDIDIAIMKDFTNPSTLIICKSGYTVDESSANASMQGFYPRKLFGDMQKAKELGQSNTNLLGVLFYTHLNKAVDTKLKHIVKYDNAINRAFAVEKEQQIASQAVASVTNFWANHKIQNESGIIPAGVCWDIRVDIHFWVVSL
jgi:hypothetical protein